ncbi:MAG TPA: hypothetical protein VLJ57_07835 [Burkholderiaceae bacterium]|nr:hypothetical protein [Burkholderiaceae bacterium]
MGSDHRFSPTVPASLTAANVGTELTAKPVHRERPDYVLAGVIGLQLSEPLADMQRIVHDLISTGKISRAQVQELSGAIETARRVAMQSQQLARLSRGRLRQSHERLALDAIVKQALAERHQFFHQRGIELVQRIKRVEVIVDPGLLSSLIEAAIDWASERGHRLTVSLEIKHLPEHGLLVFKSSPTVTTSGPGSPAVEGEFEKLSWHLLTEIAQSIGAALDRVKSSDEAVLTIEFPRTVKQLEGLTAVEMDLGADSWMPSESKSLAGHQILLVTADEGLRDDIADICGNMGLLVDCVASPEQAVRTCKVEQPHMLIVDERVRDARFDALCQELLQQDPNFPMIEIASDANTLAMASWMSDSMTRVSRGSLRAQLPQVLVLELAKIA